jgi:predicted ArsR family transcriptional regulator
MARGRNKKVSDERLLLELLLHEDRAAYSAELSQNVELGKQSIRDRMNALAAGGKVDKTELEGLNVYRLSETGKAELQQSLRELVD